MLRTVQTLALALVAGVATAQELPIVDITLVQTEGDRYEVRIRPDGPFDGLFHSYLFTLRWSDQSTATGIQLSTTAAMDEVSLYPARSGGVVNSGGYDYAPYTAETIVLLSSVGQAWVGGEEIAIATVQVNGGSVFDLQLANDAWTHANNGDFYLSLNGYERQGEIYSFGTGLASVAEEAASDVRCAIDGDLLRMTLTMDRTRELDYELLDMRGRVVAQGAFVAPDGRSEHALNVGQLAMGSYAVRLRSADLDRSMRVHLVR
ncbi:MAG: hypothetical protein KF797_04485 [Flavobacteriales bacterium]|nr:hypothetical protein [Flavobacteriales bacterium]